MLRPNPSLKRRGPTAGHAPLPLVFSAPRGVCRPRLSSNVRRRRSPLCRPLRCECRERRALSSDLDQLFFGVVCQPSRRATQEAHERFNVSVFLDEMNRRHRSTYKVVSEPNPPEAIIKSKVKTSWVEVTSAFMNRAFAEEAWSYATPGEKPSRCQRAYLSGPTRTLLRTLWTSFPRSSRKLPTRHLEINTVLAILVVSVQYPLFNDRTPHYMRRSWKKATINDQGCFRSIYLIIRRYAGYQVSIWPRDA